MKVKSGHVPKELTYVRASPREIEISWDDVELEEGETSTKETVFPAFVSDSTNKKTLSTGRSWAEQTSRFYDKASKTYKNHPLPPEVTRKNEPISKLRIVGLEHRQSAGSVYKACDQEGCYFDLREDVLLDTLRTVGVSAGGYLNGEFMWARCGSHMKLIRVGSQLWEAVSQAGERRDRHRLSLKDLQPGHVYETKTGDVYLYMGFCRGWKASDATSSKISQESRNYHNYIHYPGWAGTPPSPVPPPPRVEMPIERFRQRVWLQLRNWYSDKAPEQQIESAQKNIQENFKIGYRAISYLKFQDPPVNGCLGEYKYPGNLFEEIRQMALQHHLADTSNQKETNYILKERNRLLSVVAWLPLGTIYADGADPDPRHSLWIDWTLSLEPK